MLSWVCMRGAAILVASLVLMQGLLVLPTISTEQKGMPRQELQQYQSSWAAKSSAQTNHEQTLYAITPPRNSSPSILENGPMDSPWPMLSHDTVHSGRSQYSTVNNTGKELWQIHGNFAGEVWSSAVIDKNGTIYFATLGVDHALYAMYPNGTIKWRYQAIAQIWSTPAIAEDGTIYSGEWGGDSEFIAVSSNGKIKWTLEAGEDNSPTIAPDGTIYFGSDNTSGKGPVYAINPDGTQKWVYITNYTVLGCPAIGSDGTIYIGSGDHYFYALYPNGTLRWRYQTGSDIKGSASIAPDGTIYVPSFDNYLYAMNPNGTLRWQAYTGNRLKPPASPSPLMVPSMSARRSYGHSTPTAP